MRVSEHASTAEVADAIAEASPRVDLSPTLMAIPGVAEGVAQFLDRFGPRVQRANPAREAKAAAKRERRRQRNLRNSGRSGAAAPDAYTTDFDLLGAD